jgi:hypothetical protein
MLIGNYLREFQRSEILVPGEYVEQLEREK